MKFLSTKEAAYAISQRTSKPMSVRQLQNEAFLGHIDANRLGKRSYIFSEEAVENYARRKPGCPTK